MMFTTTKAANQCETAYGYRRVLNLPWKTAVARIKAALRGAGFSILSEIDIAQRLKEDVGLEFNGYLILSVCNPPLAVRAFQEAPDLGSLLLCNLEIYEREGQTEVAEIDTNKLFSIANHPQLEMAARHENEIIRRVIDSL